MEDYRKRHASLWQQSKDTTRSAHPTSTTSERIPALQKTTGNSITTHHTQSLTAQDDPYPAACDSEDEVWVVGCSTARPQSITGVSLAQRSEKPGTRNTSAIDLIHLDDSCAVVKFKACDDNYQKGKLVAKNADSEVGLERNLVEKRKYVESISDGEGDWWGLDCESLVAKEDKFLQNKADEQLARELQEEEIRKTEELASKEGKELMNASDSSLELIDPTPDVYNLFVDYDKMFFGGKLGSVSLTWSRRMTRCAGLCYYKGHWGSCSISLSEPLLKYRPRSDTVNTLLHEMIHAFLFLTDRDLDRDGHGEKFQFHMNRINKQAGTSITIYHTFHDEVDHYKTHWWKCTGPCQKRPPFYGIVKRAMNRAPGPHDTCCFTTKNRKACHKGNSDTMRGLSLVLFLMGAVFMARHSLGAIQTRTNPLGTSMRFRGQGYEDRVELQEIADTRWQSLTFEAWIKVNSKQPGMGTILSGNSNKHATKTFKALTSTNQLNCDDYFADADFAEKYDFTRPTHVAVTYDKITPIHNLVQLFINGSLTNVELVNNKMNFEGPSITPLQWSIGSQYLSSVTNSGSIQIWTSYYVGWLDEVRLWNYARTSTDIIQKITSSLTGMESGLVLNMPFSEGSGNTTKNQVTSGKVATVHTSNDDFESMWETYSVFGDIGISAQTPPTPSIRIQMESNTTVNGPGQYKLRFSTMMASISPDELLIYHEGTTWIYHIDLRAYEKLQTVTPSTRYGGSMAYVRGKVYMYGGTNSPGDPTSSMNEVYAFDPLTGNWTLEDKKGDGRTFHVATGMGSEMFAFYGFYNYSTLYSTARAFNVETKTWRTVKTTGNSPFIPGPPVTPAMAIHQNKLYFYGGLYIYGPPKAGTTLRTLNLDTWVWSVVATTGTPSPWRLGGILFPLGPYLLNFGGINFFVSQMQKPWMLDTRTNEWSPFPMQNITGLFISGVSQGSKAFFRTDASNMWMIDYETCPIDIQSRGICKGRQYVCFDQYYGEECRFKKCPEDCKLIHKVCDLIAGICVTPDNSGDGSGGSTPVGVIAGVCVGAAVALAVGFFIFYRKNKEVQKKAAERESQLLVNVPISEIEIGYPLGRGSFGEVYLAKWRGADVAVKKLRPTNITKEMLKSFEDEVGVMVKLRHPNIVLYMGVCLDKSNMAIISEFMSKGSLYDVIHNPDLELDIGVKLGFIHDAAKGFQYLHLSNPPILHRDLKSPNLLLDGRWNVKISDFGLTVARGAESKRDEPPGTLLWMAPEVIGGEEYVEGSDVFSYAVICWEVFTRKEPFEGEDALAAALQVLNAGRRLEFPEDAEIPMEIKEMITLAWSQEVQKRPAFKSIVETLSTFIETSGYAASYATLESFKSKKSTSGSHSKGTSASAPTGMVSMVFTDIQGSTSLWEKVPKAMAESLVLHNTLMRKCIKEHNGYEVKTEGDAFVVSFSSTTNAVKFCLKAQEVLLMADWPEEILSQPDATTVVSQSQTIFRGIRVRMGISVGEPICNIDSLTKRMDYLGPVMNRTARICSTAKGGQIVLSAMAYQEIVSDIHENQNIVWCDLGEVHLKGFSTAENLYEILPKSLEGRRSTFGNQVNPIKEPEAPNAVVTQNNETEKTKKSGYDWEVSEEDIKLKETVLGEGSYGTVYLGEYRGKDVAVKKFMKQNMKDSVYYNLVSEVLMMRELNHPNILTLIGACLKRRNTMIVVEYAPFGNLMTYLRKHANDLGDSVRTSIAKQVAEALKYMHTHQPPICHRDLKSPNVLVVSETPIRVCVADFGLARIKADNQTMTKCGTRAWLAPEVLKGIRYSEKADIFSYGILCWEIVTGKQPHSDTDPLKLASEVIKGLRPQAPKNGPPALISVMQRCWEGEPDRRPSASEIVNSLNV